MFCFHWWLTIHQWTEFQYPIPLMSKFPEYCQYIPLLCRYITDQTHIFRKVPEFAHQQSLLIPWMIQTRVPQFTKSLFEKCNVLLSLMTNNSSMNRIPISNSTYVQISCAKYIPLLCRIWPDFIQKSSLFYQQSLGMIQTRVPNSLKSPYSLDDKIRATVQLITYTVPQNCLSLFTISQITLNTVPPLCQLRGWASDFFLEGRHLSKIRLGTNVTEWENDNT